MIGTVREKVLDMREPGYYLPAVDAVHCLVVVLGLAVGAYFHVTVGVYTAWFFNISSEWS